MRKHSSRLQDLPNVGPAFERDLNLLGVHKPTDLIDRDPFEMFDELRKRTGTHQDPCVLDTFMAVVDFVKTGESKPWWAFTTERKRLIAERDGSS